MASARRKRELVLAGSAALLLLGAVAAGAAEPLALDWRDNFLTVRSPDIAGGEVRIHYLEAFCRPGSTDADWRMHTVIPHRTVREESSDGIRLRSQLEDGVVVRHHITAGAHEVTFTLVAENPTDKPSQAHWAQPCVRVDKFTGGTKDTYVPKCFVFLQGRLARLPTEPWATEARYVPGQVYCPLHVDRNDVNPRPLSSLVPSNGLVGCYSADETQILATAWEPYQELFQGVAACVHSDFRIGGLEPGQSKTIRGKLYIVPADVAALVARYERDFPEHKPTTK